MMLMTTRPWYYDKKDFKKIFFVVVYGDDIQNSNEDYINFETNYAKIKIRKDLFVVGLENYK